MKSLIIALFLGAVAPEQLEDLTNNIHISVSPAGQKVIEREAHDVEVVGEHLKHGDSPAFNRFSQSAEKWVQSPEMQKMKALDQKFLASPEGQKMVKEFKDVARVIKTNTQKTKDGIHFNNSAVGQLENEWNDVENDAKKLKGTHWDTEYTNGWEASVHNPEFKKMAIAHEQFKNSPAGHKLRKEVDDLIKALKQNVKVTDLPKEEALEEDEFVLEDQLEMLRISVSPVGQKKIETEAKDVEVAWKKIEHTQPVNNVRHRWLNWVRSPAVQRLSALDQKFMASPEGKRLMKEWREFAMELKNDVHKTPNGIHIQNSKVKNIEKEWNDVEGQYKSLKGTAWEAAYKKGWNDAVTNKAAGKLNKSVNNFQQSPQGQYLGKEVDDLVKSIKQNVKVTDLPKQSLEMDEDMDIQDLDVQELIKISVSPEGQKKIEKEGNDVETAWKTIETTPVVQNVEHKAKDWVQSPEMQRMKALDQKFLASPEGQRMVKEFKEFGKEVQQATHKTPNGIHIENSKIKGIEKEWNDVEAQGKALKGTAWETQYKNGWDAAVNNAQAKNLGTAIKQFDTSPQGHYFAKELNDLGKAIKQNVKVTDLPKLTSMEDEEDNMFIY